MEAQSGCSMKISDYDAEELAAKLLGVSEDYEPDDVEQKLWDVFF